MGTELTAKLEELRNTIQDEELGGKRAQLIQDAIALSQQPPVYAMSREPLAWVPEDELPASLPSEAYNALYPYSKVDFIRLFPVFAPSPQAVTVEGIMEVVDSWRKNDSRSAMEQSEERVAMENYSTGEWVFLPDLRTRLDQYLNSR